MRSIRLDLCMMGLAVAVACGDDDDGGASAAVANKLRECQLISEGKIAPFVIDLDFAECRANCDAAGTCAELTELVCDGRTSARIRDCYADCLSKPTECGDGRGSYLPVQLCDGQNACADGSDERDCGPQGPEFCKESGARIILVQRCNGVDDCGDGTDELDCPAAEPQFTCKTTALGIAQQIPKSKVCDLTVNCADGSDESEDQGCAQLTCP